MVALMACMLLLLFFLAPVSVLNNATDQQSARRARDEDERVNSFRSVWPALAALFLFSSFIYLFFFMTLRVVRKKIFDEI